MLRLKLGRAIIEPRLNRVKKFSDVTNSTFDILGSTERLDENSENKRRMDEFVIERQLGILAFS